MLKKVKSDVDSKKKEVKKQKKRKMFKSFLLFIIPLSIFLYIDGEVGFQNKIVYNISLAVSIICTFVGTENSSIEIAGKKIDSIAIKNRDKMTLTEKVKAFNIIGAVLSILSVPTFLGIICLILMDPFSFFDKFENVARIQLFSIFGFVLLVSILYIKLSEQEFSKELKILFFIIGIFLFSYGYFYTIPEDSNKNTLSSIEFNQVMNEYGYSVSEINFVENLDVYNSKVLLAQRDNLLIYYIISDSRKTSAKIFNSIEMKNYGECLVDGTETVSGNYKEIYCQDSNYIKLSSKIKNTMIYVESVFEMLGVVESHLKEIGYWK